MVWNTIKLKFDSNSQNLKQKLEDGLKIRGIGNLRHEVPENDYVRKVYRSDDDSLESYLLIVEGFGGGASRIRGAKGYMTEVTIMFDQPGAYQAVIERIEENAKRLDLKKMMETRE